MNHVDQDMARYIHLSKYSRWLEDKNRRETWEETVDRYTAFFAERFQGDPDITDEIMEALKEANFYTKQYKVMPSMRCMMTAGPALEKDHAAGYNCWAKAIDHQRCFDELFYLLMCGGGTGFSVERQFINKLPEVPEELHDTETVIKVPDSKIGWASSFKQLISLLYAGSIPRWDLSGLRPAGARLKTFGGRASGPEPLDQLFKFTVHLFKRARGRKLNSLDCHDLQCKVADTVIMGSVRRSATISVSNLSDDRMRRAKMGEWSQTAPWRALANNSVGYTEKPDMESFTKEFRSIYKSKAGERGIINKEALNAKAVLSGREISGRSFLLNP